jgi:prolipoprotein diacylglyceryl transferase
MTPEIFSLGPITVRWYGLLFALGFVIGYQITARIFKHEGIDEKYLDSLLMFMLISTVVGARLGHCLFYHPDYYLSNPIEILKVWEGGLASHGAAVGILTGLYLFARNFQKSYWWVVDKIVINVALAGTFIRLGNLFNSEIIGKPTDVSWAFVFTRVDDVPRHPTQLYESLSYFIIFLVLMGIYRHFKERTPERLLLGIFLIGVFGMRFLIEFLKENQAAFEASLTLNMGQFLSIPLVLAGIVLTTLALKQRAE